MDYQIINDENEYKDNLDLNNKNIYLKHYKGHNTENLIIKQNDLQIHFSYYRINGMYFVGINGEHVFDFKRLLLIDWMKNETINNKCCVLIKNSNLGEIKIENCNVKMFEKGLKEINVWIKSQSNVIKDIYNFVF